jgi:hypothetical protein
MLHRWHGRHAAAGVCVENSQLLQALLLPGPCRFWIWAGVGFQWAALLVFSVTGTLALKYMNPPSPQPTGRMVSLAAGYVAFKPSPNNLSGCATCARPADGQVELGDSASKSESRHGLGVIPKAMWQRGPGCKGGQSSPCTSRVPGRLLLLRAVPVEEQKKEILRTVKNAIFRRSVLHKGGPADASGKQSSNGSPKGCCSALMTHLCNTAFCFRQLVHAWLVLQQHLLAVELLRL